MMVLPIILLTLINWSINAAYSLLLAARPAFRAQRLRRWRQSMRLLVPPLSRFPNMDEADLDVGSMLSGPRTRLCSWWFLLVQNNLASPGSLIVFLVREKVHFFAASSEQNHWSSWSWVRGDWIPPTHESGAFRAKFYKLGQARIREPPSCVFIAQDYPRLARLRWVTFEIEVVKQLRTKSSILWYILAQYFSVIKGVI